MTQPHRIAIWNTAFLGDAVLTLPLIRIIKKTFPDAHIDMYVRAGLRSLFTAQPELMQVYDVHKRASTAAALFGLAHTVRTRAYDMWIGAHTSIRSAFMARMSGAPLRVGYTGGLSVLAYTDRVARRFDELDEIERLLQLLRPVFRMFPEARPQDLELDTPCDPTGLHWPELVLPPEAEQRAEELFQTSEVTLGLHPGSVWATKRWTVHGFADIARRAANMGARIFVFAGSGEEHMAHEVIYAAGLEGSTQVHNLSGQLSLPELAAVIKRLSVYVGNDSGPLHLAWAQHTPVVALFGPTVQKLGFYPRGSTASVFEVAQAELPCRPCGLHGANVCPKRHHRCMTDINVNAVWKAVEAQLSTISKQ